jgi:Domain of unknown function DUF1828
MQAAELEAAFRAKISERLRVEAEGLERFRVLTPFSFDDGDHLSIILRRDNGAGWVLSDEGDTYMHVTYRLKERSFTSGTWRQIIADALSMFGIDDLNGELRLVVPNEQFGDALYSFVQCILRISDVTLLSRERVHSTFMQDFRAFLLENVGSAGEFDWHHPQDPERMYSVDYYLNGKRSAYGDFCIA